MKKITKLSIFTLASVLFTGTLLSVSPVKVFADNFVPETHYLRFREIETTSQATILLTEDGKKLFGFGTSTNGISSNLVATPSEITLTLSSNETITDIDAGLNHVLVATSLNKVYIWGTTQLGAVGSGLNTLSPTPVDVTSFLNPSNKAINGVRMGSSAGFVWFTDNTILSFGNNIGGVLGRNITATPVDGSGANSAVGTLSFNFTTIGTIKRFDVKYNSAYVLYTNGQVRVWGLNTNGQLGNGNTTNLLQPTSISISGQTIRDMDIGLDHSMFITGTFENFKIYAAGNNSNGELTRALTIGTNSNTSTPTEITSLFTTNNVLNNRNQNTPFSILGGFYGNSSGSTDDLATPIYFQLGANRSYMVRSRYYLATNELYGTEDLYGWGSNALRGLGDDLRADTGVLNDQGNPIISEFLGNFAYPIGIKTGDLFYYYGEDDVNFASVSNNGNHLAIVDPFGDFVLQGDNSFGQITSQPITDEDDPVTNYNLVNSFSYNLRYFEEDVLAYINPNLTAPFDYDVEDAWFKNAFPGLNHNYYYWSDFLYETLEYYLYYLSDKELSTIKPASLDTINMVGARTFEDDFYYFDKFFQEDFPTFSDDYYEDIYYDYRDDLEDLVAYYSYWFDDTLTPGMIASISEAAQTKITNYQLMLDRLIAFEDLIDEFIDDTEIDYNDLYDFDTDDRISLKLYATEIEKIFSEFAAMDKNEVQLLNIYTRDYYEELYYAYYQGYIDEYSIDLEAINDLEWDFGTSALFDQISTITALLSRINNLPSASFDRFTEIVTYDFEEYYNYYYYEYWLYLNELLPLLIEAKPVFDLFEAIEDSDIINYDDGYYYVDVKDAKQIIDMYNAFALLSDDAKDILDYESISWYYELALRALAYEVEENLWNIEDIEYDEGYYGLFANYTDVLAALTSFEALPEDALDYLDEYSIEYYEYLLSIKLALAEGLTVYGLIINIEDNIIKYDTDGNPYVELNDVNVIFAMYTEYSKLSADAKELLDPEYVEMLYTLALQAQANVVIGQLNDLAVVEEDTGTYALFENYTDVMAALDAYNALSADAKNLLDEETQAYYAYLNGLKADLEAGLGVFNQIVTIEGLDLDNPSPATLTAISDMIDDFNSLTPAQQALLAPYVNDLKALALGRVSGLIDVLPADVESFEAAFNDPETKDAAVTNLLAAWEHYNALSDELKAQLDPLEVARLQALHARYLELIRPAMDLLMLGLIIVHLLSFTYFAFKKRDVLSPIVKA